MALVVLSLVAAAVLFIYYGPGMLAIVALLASLAWWRRV